jgi:hypothetical protein
MTFINEYISAEDLKKYDIENIDKRFIVGGTSSRSWTVDRERDIYLRTVARGREEFSHQSTWTFYWHGELIILELDNISTSGVAGGERCGHKKLRSITIPNHLEASYDEILADLKEALTAYKDGGVFATATAYSVIIDHTIQKMVCFELLQQSRGQ